MGRAISTRTSASFAAIAKNSSNAESRIKEVRAAGAQETEESAWTIDREHTFAAGGLITADDADILLDAIDQTLATGSAAFATPLADIRSKIAYLTGASTAEEPPARRLPAVDAVWSAFAERCALRFLYQNGHGEQKERTVCVYGMFEHEGVAYFCGLDNATDEIRTFRCDRIVRAWRPSKAYSIPADFNLNDRLFFEFDFADRTPVMATFSFAPQAQADMVSGLTRGRGSSRTPKRVGPGPSACATLMPLPRFVWSTPWTA